MVYTQAWALQFCNGLRPQYKCIPNSAQLIALIKALETVKTSSFMYLKGWATKGWIRFENQTNLIWICLDPNLDFFWIQELVHSFFFLKNLRLGIFE